MNKKFLSAVLFGALMVSSTGTFVSCKDYDDDIDQINNTLTDLKSQIAALQTEVEGGNWVTDLVDVEGGFKVTFNNGRTYTIVNGKDGDKGETGAAGAAGDKLTIDEATGEWKINDKATGWFANKKDQAAEVYLPKIEGGYWYFYNTEKKEYEQSDYKANGAAYAIDANGKYTMYLPTEDGKDMVKIELPKYALTSLELATTYDEYSSVQYAVASKDFKDELTGVSYKKDELIPLATAEGKTGFDVRVVANPTNTDLSDCPFSLIASDGSTLFTEGVARKYDGEIIRSAVDGLKFVNFNLAGGLKADSKAFENVSNKVYNDQNAFIGYRLSRFAVASNEISTQYGVSVYIYQSSASVSGNGISWVKVGKEYSIFGEDDNKAAGQNENYNFMYGNAVSYKLDLDKDYKDAYNVTISGDKFTVGTYTDKVLPFVVSYTTEKGEKKSAKVSVKVIKDEVANVTLSASHKLDVSKQKVYFSLDNVLNALTAEQKIAWKQANITLNKFTLESTITNDNGDPKYTINLVPSFVKKDNSGNWVTATSADATALEITVNPAIAGVVADKYTQAVYKFAFGTNELNAAVDLTLTNPTTLTRIASLFDGDNVVAYGKGNNANGEIFNVLSVYEQNGATFDKANFEVEVVKNGDFSDTDVAKWVVNGSQITINDKAQLYNEVAKVKVSVPVFAGNDDNKFTDVIYVTAKSPVKEGTIEALKTTLSLKQSKSASFGKADFSAADVWGTAYNLFGYTYVENKAEKWAKPATDYIKDIKVTSSTSLVTPELTYNGTTKTYENMSGFKVTVDDEAALQSGDKVTITIKITDMWGMEFTKDVELTVEK